MTIMLRFRPTALVAAALLVCLAAGPLAAKDETAESAVWLLKKATLVHRDGMHNILLRALRQLDDPDLKPLFSDLVQKQHPVLKIHGILALGEIDTNDHIDLALVADVKNTATQAQLVSSALEADLLSVEQCKQLIAWPGLDEAVKVIVATKLVHHKQLTDQSVLTAAIASDNMALRSMAALLKLELGDAAAAKHLDELNLSDQSIRETVQIMLLQTAVRYEFASIAPWALKLADDPTTEQNLAFLALRTAMRFKAPGAAESWERLFKSTIGPADRLRLAVLALDVAERLEPAVFDALATDTDEVIRQMGVVGKLRAAGQPAGAEVLKLLAMNNLLASQWALQHALEIPHEQGRELLVGIIFNAEGGENPERFRGQRLENSVLAAERMAEKDADAATLIPHLLQNTPSLTQEAILVGLIRSKVDARPMIAPITKWPNDTAEYLALLLKIKNGEQPTPEQMQSLAMIVRGGAKLQDPLRIQAAWLYLKLTQQDRFALANVLGQR